MQNKILEVGKGQLGVLLERRGGVFEKVCEILNSVNFTDLGEENQIRHAQ